MEKEAAEVPTVWDKALLDVLRPSVYEGLISPPDYYTTEYSNRFFKWLGIFGKRVGHWNMPSGPITFRKIDSIGGR